MQMKLAALFATSLAAVAVAGGSSGGSSDSVGLSLFELGMPEMGLDPMLRNSDSLQPENANATIMFAHDYPNQAQMMFSQSIMASISPSNTQPTATRGSYVEQPSPTASKSCSLKGRGCQAYLCKQGGGTCSYSYGSCDYSNLSGPNAPFACQSCSCTLD